MSESRPTSSTPSQTYGLRHAALSPMETLAPISLHDCAHHDACRHHPSRLCSRRKRHMARVPARNHRDSSGRHLRRTLRPVHGVPRIALHLRFKNSSPVDGRHRRLEPSARRTLRSKVKFANGCQPEHQLQRLPATGIAVHNPSLQRQLRRARTLRVPQPQRSWHHQQNHRQSAPDSDVSQSHFLMEAKSVSPKTSCRRPP